MDSEDSFTTRLLMIREIRIRIAGDNRKLIDVAAEIGCSPSFLSMVLHNRRNPTDRILRHFGYERVEIYRRIDGYKAIQ